jgi:hypothetical protein
MEYIELQDNVSSNRVTDNVRNQFLERLAITEREEYNNAIFSSEPRQLSVNLSGTPVATNLNL